MIIDATDLLLGRLAALAAKKSLLGEKVEIVNCGEAVISGNKKSILAHYKRKADMGIHTKGPFIPKYPGRFVRRTIRGMLPHKQPKGRVAYKNIKCHNGLPEILREKKLETFGNMSVSKLPSPRFIKLKTVCKMLGGKI